MRKILYVSGTRADYGLMKSILHSIKKHPKLSLDIVATGMHLMPQFGHTVSDIKKDGFDVIEINRTYEKDDYASMSKFVGEFAADLTQQVNKSRPDVIMVLGDRGEMLAAAIVGAYSNIPVAHVHGGELSMTIDGVARHAITKLSHIHFPATKQSAERIVKMGEEPWRVHVVGAPGLDPIVNSDVYSKEEVYSKLNLDPSKKTLLIIQHPVTGEDSASHIRETMEAVKELGMQSVVVYPNADAGGRKMVEVIEEYRTVSFMHIFNNIEHKAYLSLMNSVEALIGNSSSGIIEAASFKLPVVNIGTRQGGREHSTNVIHTGYEKNKILDAVRRATSPEFKKDLANCVNPYGDGKTGPRVAEILADININNKLLMKQMTY